MHKLYPGIHKCEYDQKLQQSRTADQPMAP